MWVYLYIRSPPLAFKPLLNLKKFTSNLYFGSILGQHIYGAYGFSTVENLYFYAKRMILVQILKIETQESVFPIVRKLKIKRYPKAKIPFSF